MIRFYFDKIQRSCKYDVTKIVQYFYLTQFIPYKQYFKISKETKALAEKGLPRNRNSPQTDSYILNIDDLLKNPLKVSDRDIFNYIKLASARNYFDYKSLNNKHLDYDVGKELVPELSIRQNRYLTVEKNKIHFNFE